MAIIHRRTFYAKVGHAGPLVAHLREFGKLAAQHGMPLEDRILTMEALQGNQAAADAFTKWERTMNAMIDYAEVENWKVE